MYYYLGNLILPFIYVINTYFIPIKFFISGHIFSQIFSTYFWIQKLKNSQKTPNNFFRIKK